jgi:hypothetical protein
MTDQTLDPDVIKLEGALEQVASHAASPGLFVEAIDQIDWRDKGPEFFKYAIGLALQLQATRPALRIAEWGREQYPEDEYLQRAARVLAPPKVIDTKRPAVKGISKSMEWLQDHARDYYGQWVAVLAGKLVGSASSRAELVENLGELSGEPTLLITRIV